MVETSQIVVACVGVEFEYIVAVADKHTTTVTTHVSVQSELGHGVVGSRLHRVDTILDGWLTIFVSTPVGSVDDRTDDFAFGSHTSLRNEASDRVRIH